MPKATSIAMVMIAISFSTVAYGAPKPKKKEPPREDPYPEWKSEPVDPGELIHRKGKKRKKRSTLNLIVLLTGYSPDG